MGIQGGTLHGPRSGCLPSSCETLDRAVLFDARSVGHRLPGGQPEGHHAGPDRPVEILGRLLGAPVCDEAAPLAWAGQRKGGGPVRLRTACR